MIAQELTIRDYRADLLMYERDLHRAILTRHRTGPRFGTPFARRSRIRVLVRSIRSLRSLVRGPAGAPRQLDLFGWPV